MTLTAGSKPLSRIAVQPPVCYTYLSGGGVPSVEGPHSFRTLAHLCAARFTPCQRADNHLRWSAYCWMRPSLASSCSRWNVTPALRAQTRLYQSYRQNSWTSTAGGNLPATAKAAVARPFASRVRAAGSSTAEDELSGGSTRGSSFNIAPVEQSAPKPSRKSGCRRCSGTGKVSCKDCRGTGQLPR